jgi:hypothetical protein
VKNEFKESRNLEASKHAQNGAYNSILLEGSRVTKQINVVCDGPHIEAKFGEVAQKARIFCALYRETSTWQTRDEKINK